MNAKKLLVALAIKYDGNWEEIYRALIRKDFLIDEEVEKLCRTVKSKVVTILDANYPEYLKNYYRPPFVLFYYGDISLLFNPIKNIAVVGTRNPSEKATLTTRAIVSKVSKEYVVVSGLARGIDKISHEAAIYSGGKTIGVLGCGIDICYPSENFDLYQIMKNKHLIISEYCGQSTPDQTHFPQRNRLIAMFSIATFIPEATLNSGTSITANYTEQCNHSIYCLPSGEYVNSLTNSLIRDGAGLVRNADDLLYDLQK